MLFPSKDCFQVLAAGAGLKPEVHIVGFLPNGPGVFCRRHTTQNILHGSSLSQKPTGVRKKISIVICLLPNRVLKYDVIIFCNVFSFEPLNLIMR